MKKSLPKNVFYDINKLPSDWGILIFPISLSLTANTQYPDNCLEYIRKISPTKVVSPTIGLNFLYSETLYLDNYASLHRNRDIHKQRLIYIQEMEKHKNRMLHIIRKLQTTEFQIPWAVDFMSWNQAIINTKSFATRFGKVKKLYQNDNLFKKYLQEDLLRSGREENDANVNFFLEEHLLCYLTSRGEVGFHNNHVQNRQRWLLWCYPGKPPKALVYLHQLNPFGLHWDENRYQTVAQYDLLEMKLYETANIDLDTYDL